ncbi:MAG TPA: ATP-binding protein [bacterium]
MPIGDTAGPHGGIGGPAARLSGIRPGRASMRAWQALAALAAAVPAASAWASEDSSLGNARALWIIVTIALSTVVAVWLYDQARRTGSGGPIHAKASGAREAEPPRPSAAEPIPPDISQHLSSLKVPPRKREQVAKQLSQLMSQRLEEKSNSVRRELTQKYERVLEERTRNEAIIRKQYRQVLVEKKQTESIMRSVADGLVVVDNTGKVVFINPAAERLLSAEKERKVGRPLTEGLGDEQLISLVKSGSSESEREIELNAKVDQTRKILRASNAVIEDENGNTVGMVAVLSDVTKQRELDRMKSEFVSKVTHELRTPIVAIKHSLSVVLDGSPGPMNDMQKNFVGIASRNAERLGRLIDDLLDLGKIEAKKMVLKREPIPIAQVIGDACEGISTWATAKSLTIQRDVHDGLPPVPVDTGRLVQVLSNLLSNAIKFTPAGGTITVSASKQEGGAMLRVAVRDTGVGIEHADLPKLFQKFQQVGSSNQTEISGTGLGLAISKEIVELHGGRISVESQPGQGTTFSFTLPMGDSA